MRASVLLDFIAIYIKLKQLFNNSIKPNMASDSPFDIQFYENIAIVINIIVLSISFIHCSLSLDINLHQTIFYSPFHGKVNTALCYAYLVFNKLKNLNWDASHLNQNQRSSPDCEIIS